jgi:hypothetical protein
VDLVPATELNAQSAIGSLLHARWPGLELNKRRLNPPGTVGFENAEDMRGRKTMETILTIASIALLISGIDLVFTYTKESASELQTGE